MEMKFKDVLCIIDHNQDYLEEETSQFYYKPEIDVYDWKYINVEELEYDLEHGWCIESFILQQESTGKNYSVELTFIGGEGYLESENEEILVLAEVEPYKVIVTKYKLKDEISKEAIPPGSTQKT